MVGGPIVEGSCLDLQTRELRSLFREAWSSPSAVASWEGHRRGAAAALSVDGLRGNLDPLPHERRQDVTGFGIVGIRRCHGDAFVRREGVKEDLDAGPPRIVADGGVGEFLPCGVGLTSTLQRVDLFDMALILSTVC